MSSINSSYNLYCYNMSQQSYPDNSVLEQEQQWGMQGLQQQMGEGDKSQEKIQKQTEAVINAD